MSASWPSWRMVMNLDKCIGCHTCSVTCKQAWTNRAGVEYVWFNNVETRPGQGYPRTLPGPGAVAGRLGAQPPRPARSCGRAAGSSKLLSIFANPLLPNIQDYYEPWTYDYEKLSTPRCGDDFPVARPTSLITGKPMKIKWSANWDDDLGGGPSRPPATRSWRCKQPRDKVTLEFEQAFMFYLPRICEHCLNPSCVASCPSGAMYKRAEDGIVLVDQDRCRGWRMCVTGCPYKKVYFNHRTGKAEKCTFCYPRVEVGLPTVCSETCVGRLRYIGLVLYDADRVTAAASVAGRARPVRGAARRAARPARPGGDRRGASATGSPRTGSTAAQRSPVYALINSTASRCRCTRSTARCRWSGTSRRCRRSSTCSRETGHDGEDADNLFGAIDALRIPIEYLAELFTAGDPEPVARGAAPAGRDALVHARRHPRPRAATSPSRRRSA